MNNQSAQKRPTLRLKPHTDKRLRAGSPWLFSNEVTMDAATKTLVPGSLVEVADAGGTAYGTGYFNPHSLIAARVLSPEPGAAIDAAFFAGKFVRALNLRASLFEAPYYRLINAEGDGLPGLTIDRFDACYVVQISTAGMEALQAEIFAGLEQIVQPQAILLRADMPARDLEGLERYVRTEKGSVERLTVLENGVRYFADVSGGQKTGWYYDQRDNRAFAASLTRGRSFLDLYCYCGGFALAAAKGGAKSVLGIDSSAPALDLARESAAANGLKADFEKADALAALEKLAAEKTEFDVVSADPPPFVKSRKDLESGARAYRKLAKMAAAVTAKDGILMLASCSHHMPAARFAAECAAGISRAGRTARLLRLSGAAADHPTHPMLPESAYLKAATFALD